MMSQRTSHLMELLLSFSTPDISHDIRPGQCGDADLQPHWYDVAAMSLGWLPPVPGTNAAGISVRLLGVPQQDGGKCKGTVSAHTEVQMSTLGLDFLSPSELTGEGLMEVTEILTPAIVVNNL